MRLQKICKRLLTSLTLLILLYPNISAAQENDGFNPVYNPPFYVHMYNNFYFPGDTVEFGINARWMKRLEPDFKINVYKIRDANEFLRKQTNEYSIEVIGRDTSNLLALCDAVDSFRVTLKYSARQYGKNKNDTVFYTDDKVKYLPHGRGMYIVKVSYRKKSAYTAFNVTRIGLIVHPSHNSVLTYTVDRQTGEPIDSVQLDYFTGYVKTDSVITEKSVYNKVYSENEQELNYHTNKSLPLIIVRKGDDVTVSDFRQYYNNLNERRYTAYIYTNQPVYRPLSKIGFFGVIRENTSWGYGNVIQKDVVVTVKDTKGAEIFKKVLKTDDNGCFNDSLELEEEIPLGNYSITAEIEKVSKFIKETDDVNPETFSAYFSVEEFKKPEFKVDLKTVKSQYSNGEQLKVNVKSDYYFGSPVQNAYVEYNIFKKPLYRPWWYYSPYSWWYEDYYSRLENNYNNRNTVLIYSGKGNLDNEGKMEVNYTINEDFKVKYGNQINIRSRDDEISSDMVYVVQVTVRDKSRRNISQVTTVNVTRSDYFLVAQADRYMVKPGEKIGVEVKSFDFSDKPVVCRYNITVNRITYEGKYPKQKKITNFLTTISSSTRADGSSTIYFEAGSEGYYSMEITSFDSKKRKITAGAGCFVSSGKMAWWSFQPGTIDIFTDKESYKPGDTCRALVVCAHDTADIIEVSSNKNLISYRTDKIESGSQYIDIPIMELGAPNFYISISYINNGVIYTKSKPVVVIPENKFLNVEISSDKPAYKPREESEILVKVTDIMNNPVRNARLTLSMVDESIYAVKPDNTVDIKKTFYAPLSSYSLPYFSIYSYGYGSSSNYSSIYMRYDYQNAKDSLCTVRGRVIDRRSRAYPNVLVMLDKYYLAAITAYDGTFKFKIPPGKYNISFIIHDNDIEGEFDINLENQKKPYLEIKTDGDFVISAWLNDKETGELDVRGGKLDRTGINFSDSLISDIDIISQRKGIDVEQSGRLVTMDTLSIDNTGIRGIQNISAKTSGVIDWEGMKAPSEDTHFVEAETRTDFRDAIYWSAVVQTDYDGNAKVKVKLPDNLTTWRITSRAITDNTDVGQSTGSVLCRKDLLIRVETPRFFQQRDEVTVSTIVHNYLSEDKKTKVKLSADNLMLDSSNEKVIDLKKNEERRIDWKVKVNNPVGVAKITGSALTNEESDAMEIKVPVQPYGLKVSNQMSFDFSKDNRTVARKFEIPEDADIRTAKLNINISPSIVSSLLSSLNSLIAYPYGCMEQTTSRFVPAVQVNGILKELNAPVNEYLSVQLPKVIKKGLVKIYAAQHTDGGWGWWNNDKSEPFMTTYVIYGLTLAKQNGTNVKEDIYKKGLFYITSLITGNKFKLDTTTLAFMIYSLSITDSANYDLINAELKKYEDAKKDDFTRALFVLASLKAGNRNLAGKYLEELAAGANYTDEGVYWGGKIFRYRWQDDNVQTTSFVLKALLADEGFRKENKQLIEKTVDWLMLRRKGNSWGSTQQNASIIFALSDYVKFTNELEPDYNIKIFMNNAPVFEKRVTKDDVYGGDIIVEIGGGKIKKGENQLRIEKSGAGKVYFSSDFSFYSGGKRISSESNGFEVEREYFKLAKEFDAQTKILYYRKSPVKGALKSGDIVLVKINVIPSGSSSKYFMMEDPVPAGCEIINDDWAYNIQGEKDYTQHDYYWWRWWYTERVVRDNRISFFASSIYGQSYEFSYLLRAEIPGKFNVMPPKAMLMYYPEFNGNGESSIIKIED